CRKNVPTGSRVAYKPKARGRMHQAGVMGSHASRSKSAAGSVLAAPPCRTHLACDCTIELLHSTVAALVLCRSTVSLRPPAPASQLGELRVVGARSDPC